jgi:phosphatidylethanolamine/phosphatidyl-N-methylethanolamine N-methyltransferase
MPEKKSFIKQFWKEKKMVGSMIPSSRYLADKMLENIDFESARVLVELGPGTGVFTEKILEKMHKEAKILVFELNEDFFNLLQKRINDPRVILINDSAESMEQYLTVNNLSSADYVISSLPLTNFTAALRKQILENSKRILRDNGKYIQFQYSLLLKKQIQQIFPSVSIAFTPLNFPPAFVYTCSN